MNLRTNEVLQISNPVNPSPGQMWVKPIGLVGSPGQAIGTLGLTYASPVAQNYILTYRTNENSSVGTTLNNYGG